jgi:hypothetical protein
MFLPMACVESSPIKVSAAPQEIYIEKDDFGQFINFDFIIENLSDQTLRLDRVELSVLDDKGKLVLRKRLDAGGTSPSILTIPNREIEAKQSALVFNPFHSFAPFISLKKLRYEFSFFAKAQKQEHKYEVFVTPVLYETKTSLILPVKEKLIVNSGHDFYAHHRRLDYLHPIARLLGFTANFMRYGYDFFVINEDGERYRREGATNEDWFGFGAQVYAPGSGRVVAASGDYPEDLGGRNLSVEKIKADPMLFYGNHVVIDHLNGEYSMLAHLKQGSVRVKVGEAVKQGQMVAQVGTSGSAEQPHLHYELRTGSDFKSEGVPSYFRNFRRFLGSESIEVKKGRIDTGDIVRSGNGNFSPFPDRR